MSEELEVLKEVARQLEKAAIAYMITGSIAANFYTVPRMTRDIDIVVELSERDIDQFVRLFEDEYYLEPQTVREAVKSKRMFNLIHDEYIIKIDFVVRKDTPYRRREFSRRKKVKVDDQELFVVSPEDLILSKLEWAKDSHSEVQLNDVRNLLRDVQGLKPKVSCPLGKEFGPRIPLPRGKQVKDTPAAIERKFRKMLLKRSGAERLKMGCSMHATARALAKAYLSERHPDAPPLELKRLLFLHFYNTDFKPDDKRRIASALSENRRFRNVLDASKRTSRRPLELKNLAIVKSSGEGTVREKAQGYGAKRKTKAKHLR